MYNYNIIVEGKSEKTFIVQAQKWYVDVMNINKKYV